MANQDSSLESGSEVEEERRDYPSEYHLKLLDNISDSSSQMVSKHVLQYDHLGSLQLLRSWNLGSNELAWRWRSSVASSCQCWQCAHLLLDGR